MHDTRRLDRLLEFRIGEEERALAQEAALLRQVEAIRQRARALESQLTRNRRPGQALPGWRELRDEQLWGLKLHGHLQAQRALLRQHEVRLAEARAEVAEAGRRRLAVQGMAEASRLSHARRREAASQSDVDEHGRLQALLREG
ncbi:MAG TPA: hypothetical protein DEP45_01720 [Armatimonadetes bacterium]|nr:hypothetical protein [Armatimonadota bacterium]